MSFIECYEQIEEEEIEYLLAFLFQLTIDSREIHGRGFGREQVVALRQLNEIAHRVLNRIRDIGSEAPWSDRRYLIRMVPHHVELGKGIESGVNSAARRALEMFST